jgi:hypothetical protein
VAKLVAAESTIQLAAKSDAWVLGIFIFYVVKVILENVSDAIGDFRAAQKKRSHEQTVFGM